MWSAGVATGPRLANSIHAGLPAPSGLGSIATWSRFRLCAASHEPVEPRNAFQDSAAISIALAVAGRDGRMHAESVNRESRPLRPPAPPTSARDNGNELGAATSTAPAAIPLRPLPAPAPPGAIACFSANEPKDQQKNHCAYGSGGCRAEQKCRRHGTSMPMFN
jgi:hypothetical protein